MFCVFLRVQRNTINVDIEQVNINNLLPIQGIDKRQVVGFISCLNQVLFSMIYKATVLFYLRKNFTSHVRYD